MRRHLTVFFFFLVLIQAAGAAAYDFSPGVSLAVTGEYNDNIYLTKTDKRDDFITYLTPSVFFSLRSANNTMRISYSPSFSMYASNDDLNSTSHNASAHGSFTLSDKTSFGIGDTYVRSKELRYLLTISEFGPIRRRVEREANTASGSMTYRFSGKFSSSLGASYGFVNSTESGFNDVKTYSGDVRLSYMKSPRTTFSATARYTKYDYSLSGDANSQDYTLGLTYRISPTLTLAAAGGVVLTKVENNGRQESDFSGGIDLTQRLEKGTATLSLSQTVVSGVEDARPLKSQAASLRLVRPLSESWTVSITPSYTKFKSVSPSSASGASNTDANVFIAGIDLTYAVKRWANLILSYNYANYEDRTINARDYSDNRISLTFRMSYEKGQAERERTQEPLPQQQPMQQQSPQPWSAPGR